MVVRIVEQNPSGVASRILILPRPEAPPEGGQGRQPEADRERREEENKGHAVPLFRDSPVRRALSVTARDEPDMAMAAMNGLIRPSMAAGAATAL